MSNPDGFPECASLSSRPDGSAPETPASLAATLAKIRREALERVTDQLNGKNPALEKTSLFGDIRHSVGKAFKERSETAGFPLTFSASWS